MSEKKEIKIEDKVEELVEFLFEKGMSQENYLRVANWQEIHKSYNMLGYCKKIYDLFSYSGLSYDQIEIFIVGNLNIFLKPWEEIIKIAFVLSRLNSVDELFSSGFLSRGITNYKRLFIRDFVCKRSGKYDRGNSASVLLSSDAEAYQKYNLSLIAYHAIGVSSTSDEDLENALNKCLLLDGVPITVDEYLERSAKLFYIKYIRNTNSKRRK